MNRGAWRVQSMESQKVGHDGTHTHTHTIIKVIELILKKSPQTLCSDEYITKSAKNLKF